MLICCLLAFLAKCAATPMLTCDDVGYPLTVDIPHESSTTTYDAPNRVNYGESLSNCANTTIAVDGYYKHYAIYAPNQDCTLTIQIPNDTAVYLILSVDKMDNASSARIWNDYGNEFKSKRARFCLDVYWPPSVVYVQMKTGPLANVSMGLWIYPVKIQLGTNTTTAYLHDGVQPLIFDSLTDNSTYVFTSDSYVALAAVASDTTYYQYFMNLFVYEGQGDNLKLIGTMYNMVNSNNYISSGMALTIYITEYWMNVGEGQIILNDYGNVASFNGNAQYRWAKIYGASDYQQVSLDASVAPASLSILNSQFGRWPLLVGIQYSNTSSTLTAFAGLPTSNMTSLYITEYPALDSASRLSQLFPGTMLTLVLDKGTATVNFTATYNSAADWGIARARKGVLISNDYGFRSNSTINTMMYTFHQKGFNDINIMKLNLCIGNDFAYGSNISYWSTNHTNDMGQYRSISSPSPMNISVVGREFGVNITLEAFVTPEISSMGQIVHFEMVYDNVTIGTTPTTTSSSSSSTITTSTASTASTASISSTTSTTTTTTRRMTPDKTTKSSPSPTAGKTSLSTKGPTTVMNNEGKGCALRHMFLTFMIFLLVE